MSHANGERIDLNLLGHFLAVAETASFSAAAKKLGLTGPSVSRGVAALEQSLGVQLFARTTRHVALTTAGERLRSRVGPGLSALREALETLPESRGVPSGEIRVTAPVDFATLFLPAVLATFQPRYPQVRVDVRVTGAKIDLVADGIDLAIRGADAKMKDSSLVATRIANLERHVYGSPSYLSRRGTPKTPEVARTHSWVSFRNARIGPPLSVDPSSATVVGDDLLFVRAAVTAGLGLGLLPPFLTRELVERGELVRVLPRVVFRSGGLFVVCPPFRHVRSSVAAFRDHLLNYFRANPP